MNTPKPCDTCNHLYVDAMTKHLPDGFVQCIKGHGVGFHGVCPDYEGRTREVRTMNDKHTPLKVVRDDGLIYIMDEDGNDVALMLKYQETDEERQAQFAEFIVKACNEHERNRELIFDLFVALEDSSTLVSEEFFKLRERVRGIQQRESA